jgi:hypothetical protein
MTSTNFSGDKSALKRPRSLPVSEWPDAERCAWEEACRPGSRLRPGGVASCLAEVSRDDFARRYGAANALWISSTTGLLECWRQNRRSTLLI